MCHEGIKLKLTRLTGDAALVLIDGIGLMMEDGLGFLKVTAVELAIKRERTRNKAEMAV